MFFSSPRFTLAVVLAAGLVGAAGGASAQTPPTPAQTPPPAVMPGLRPVIIEQVLVKVNGEIITKTDLETRQVAILRQRNQQLSDAELQKALVELTPDVLVEAVDEMLLLQRGKELGYRMTDERFKQILENIRKENKLETDEQFQAALRNEGMTLADLRKSLETRMLVSQVEQQEVLNRIAINEEEARRYFDAHSKDFTTPPSMTLREVLISVPGDGKTINVGLDEEAKAKAEAARDRARAGESMEKIVAEVSEAPSKANGGVIGPINRDELAPQFQEMVAKLKAGDLSEIVRTPRGYYFFKLETASDAVVLPFDKARDQIADRVIGEKRAAEFLKYIRKLRGEALIEWKSLEFKKLYDARVAALDQAPKPGL